MPGRNRDQGSQNICGTGSQNVLTETYPKSETGYETPLFTVIALLLLLERKRSLKGSSCLLSLGEGINPKPLSVGDLSTAAPLTLCCPD